MAAVPVQDVAGLSDAYTPTLIAFDDPPRIEYINADVPHISRRIDERFDLLLDMETREPIGFTLYGKWTSALLQVPPSQGDVTARRAPLVNAMKANLGIGQYDAESEIVGFVDAADAILALDNLQARPHPDVSGLVGQVADLICDVQVYYADNGLAAISPDSANSVAKEIITLVVKADHD